jgi:nucleotide-binding universal stress UspA family protein
MSYKTILVHVDDSKHVDLRIEAAANIAVTEKAHLIGVAMTGIPNIIFDPTELGPADPALAQYLEIFRQRAAAALTKFENSARLFGVESIEKRLVENETAAGLTLQARYTDLVVLGQVDPDEPSVTPNPDLPQYVIMNSGVPVLMIPYATAFSSVGNRVLISWNASKEVTQAVHYALPLLQRAKKVDVAIFNPEDLPVAYGALPESDFLAYLARHNIKANVTRQTAKGDIDIGNALLSLAADLTSDLLVMGCYGHSRFREILLGGVTRTILNSMTIPVLMSH